MDISLEQIGLTRNEGKVYLALLRLGATKTGPLLKESGLNLGKIYEILESLKTKGLVSETAADGVRKFTASPPSQLQQYLELKKQKIEEQEKVVKAIVPQLEKLRSQLLPEKRIVTYTGFRGIVTAAEEALECTGSNQEILSLGISDINAWSQRYWVRWEKMRQRKSIRARYILSEKGKIYNDLKKENAVSLRLLQKDTPVGIDIYGKDKVLILHYQEPISCTLIYDENTARTFKSYFETLWKIAKPLK